MDEADKCDDGLASLYLREQMRRVEMIMAGHEIAIIEGLAYCEEYEVAPLPALLRAAHEALARHVRAAPKRRGRSSSAFARYRQDMIDFARYEEIKCIEESREWLAQELQELERLSSSQAQDMTARLKKILTGLGDDLEGAFGVASVRLENTAARGSFETIRRSYYAVLENLAQPKEKSRYTVLDQKILSKLGLEGLRL